MRACRLRAEVRLATPDEVPILASLHAQCFPAAWKKEFLAGLLAQRGAFFLLAESEGQPVGFAIGRAVADEAELLSLGVVPVCRRQGIGDALLRTMAELAFADGAAVIFLEVSIANEAALALYAHLGFGEVGRRAAYYADPPDFAIDALVLRRNLPF